MSLYPQALQEIVDLMEHLSESERREALISYAELVEQYQPREQLAYIIRDVRHDKECLDEVGVFLYQREDGNPVFHFYLGPQVQTLTRAMAGILCKGLEQSSLEDIIRLRDDFVPKVAGERLMRLRSQTVYYMLLRMKEAALACMRLDG